MSIATERYSETLNSALTYFSSLAQSTSGWKRLSSATVRSTRNGTSGSPGTGGKGSGAGSSSAASSPNANRHGSYEDPMASLLGGATPSSAASAAIESLLPAISVSRKSVPGKSAEIVRASILLPGLNEQTDLEDWRAVLECTGARKIWDQMVESSTVLMTLDDSTCITKTIFKTTWPASPRDALLIETTLLDHNAVLHIATSIKPSHDDPIFMRPSPPHVRAYLPLVAWHIQLVPADLDDAVSFTSFNSLAATQNRPVMPRHSIRVSFYYQIDMRGWAVNSSVSMQSHVPSCIANVYRLLRRQGVPPHVSRHSPRIQLDLNEYDPATGIYELRYDVIPLDSEDLLVERRTVSSALKQFRLGSAIQEEGQESSKDTLDSSSIPQEIVLSDDDETDEADADNPNHDLQYGYVDVELDGEKWGVGSDIVVHIFMNDIEDEEFVQEHVECLKYMGRDRYILRMKHTEIGSNHGAINVKLRIERIPQQNTGGANLLSHQQLRFQRQQQEQELQLQQRQQEQGHENPSNPDMTGLIVSVNGHEKNITPFHRSSIQGAKRVSMSLQEQLELSQQIVQEVDDSSGHWRSGSEGLDSQEQRSTASPLLLMSSSMPTTMQSLNRSNQSILSNGTSTMAPGNTNSSKVNSSYTYFNSLLQEPASSWKAISKQRGVQISKLETQGHAPGIVKGEGIFEDYSIWDLKAVLDCASARKIWDKMFDESHMLQQVTPSSILSYVRLKGFWPTSPKDMAVLNTTFITKDAIHYFATSVDDTTQYPSIPPPVSPFVRSELVVSGWYLEAIKPRSVRVVYIAQAPPTGWMVPGSALGAMTTEMPLCVAEIIKYLETYGSPPTLVSIRRGRALGVDYSHEKSSFRLEYAQDSNPIFSGHRVLLQQQQQQQQQVQAGDRYRRSTVDYTAGAVGSGEHQSLNSPKLGPTDKLLAEIRLDARTWARNGDSEITIDPPPSKVTCSCVPHDGTGYRLRIEHSSGRAVPAGGKVLLMARKSAKPGCGIVVNGVAIKMPSMEHLDSWMPRKSPEAEKDKALTMSMVDGALAEKEVQEEDEDDSLRTKLNGGNASSTAGGDDTALAHASLTGSPDKRRSPEKLQTPLQYAQSAMNLLSRIRSEPEDSWSVVSDSKGGMRVTKRFMPTEISDQVPLVRGEKVMEGFSLEEIATVIGTLGTRSKLDDLFESGEMLESFGAGCSVFHHVLKSYFPVPLLSRDLYFVTATASVEASARCPQVVILSTSVPLEAISHSSPSNLDGPPATIPSPSSPAQARPRAHLYLSAWILERIDPYSTSHPIPSTRVTYMTALDLGGSVPQRVSGMIQTMFPKMITQVETYLQAHAAPPIVRIPEQMIVGLSSETDTEFMEEGHEKPMPSIIPWVAPANRLISSEFRLKDCFCEVVLLFDQFRLSPSRLDLAAERRARKHKKNRQKFREDRDHARNIAEAEETEDDATSSQEQTSQNRTVLEMIVDLKQYPIGYNIMTNIKVDPEFLLQQKQQRDSVMKQSMMAHSTSSIKRSGSALLQAGSSANSSTSKFIGGFESSASGAAVDSGDRPSQDGDVGHIPGGSKSSSSEAASSGTGIAAVLGCAANLSRPLPSSTSLIRILPPPLTVHVIDIPPAPSHSSSLSGVSKRRKHLIIVTVPEAESSQAYAQAQQQQAAAVSQQSLKSAAPLVISGTTAKPVMTASTIPGSTSMNFAADGRGESPRSRPPESSSSSSQDTDFATSEAGKPAFSPSTLVSSETVTSTKTTLLASVTKPAMAMETRMFQFGVKIDRLEHAAAQATKETLGSLAEEMEWLGRVLVDGVPVKVMTNFSRQELGFTDGMMEDDEDGAEPQRGRSPQQNGRVSSDEEMGARRTHTGKGHGDGGHGLYSDEGEPTSRSKSGSRKRKHHRQQLAQMSKRQDSGSGAEDPEEIGSRNNSPGPALESPSKAESDSNRRPTSSLSGFSAFLMNVGILSQRGSRADLDTVAEKAHDGEDDRASKGSSTQSQGQGRSSVEYEDLDDDRTIRASKSVSRNRISDAMNNRSSSGRKKTKNGGKKPTKADPEYEHDLDLESLHGSIVFQNHQDSIESDLYGAPSGTAVLHSEIDVEYDERRNNRDVLDWARESGSVRRRKGQEATVQDEGFTVRDDRSSQGERSPMDSEVMIPSAQTQHHHRQGSRSSLTARHRSRASPSHSKARRSESTNGADHPRFRGSLLYAYTFRNLFWCAAACFLLGLLLRLYVIGPSFLKTVSRASGGPNSSGYTTTYYYYRAAPRRPTSGTSTSPASKTLSPLTGKGSRGATGRERDRFSQHQQQGEDRTSSAEAELEGSVWPQGIREVFTVRRMFGWDFVLLAYPAQEQQQQQ
ncbi:hypothetical protein EC968_007385 [Mortierella alpina]|nr:hypothetical protein EC968_007385 [Mortierella alpina]